MVEIVGLDRVLAGGDGLLAQRGGALGPEPPDGACDLGRVARPGFALEERPVMDQRLALLPRETAVVPEVRGGGGDAVDGAPGQEEGIQRGQQNAAREDAERANEVVDDAGAAVVPVVGEELVRACRLVGLEPALGALAHDRVGMRVEEGAERLALGVAGGRETGCDVADVVGEARRRKALRLALLVEGGERRDVGRQHVEAALQPVREDEADALLDGGVGRRGLADQVVGARGEREEGEQERREHQR